jgi:hypothetical protein
MAIAQNHLVEQIVSGGQTGADRAALDWAIANGLPHGGWCPKGRLAEDGCISMKYQLMKPRGCTSSRVLVLRLNTRSDKNSLHEVSRKVKKYRHEHNTCESDKEPRH